MSPERWEQISEIYANALELDPDERNEFLKTACAGDEALRREVESLLAADAAAGDFIAEPILKNAPPIFAPETAASSLIGKKLGHYQIVSRLGVGGMGEVYLAKDTRLNRPVALKTLPVSLSNHPDYLQRFQIEAEAAATLNHPHVATIYSVEKIENQPVITMEYVEGKTLDKLIPAGGLDVKTFLEWFIPAADALAHAHEKGVVHRDIKPGNIMIAEDGAPKILDFGLAQIERETAFERMTTVAEHISTLKMTQPGQIIGTPSYMSPEQAEGKEIDARTDIFSLGVVMYEAITGRRPFTGDSYASIVGSLLKTEPPDVSEIKPETPYLLARLVKRCLNKSRRHRFQSMREIRVLLEEIQAAVEAGVSMDSFAKRLLPKPERRRGWVFAALFFFVAALSVFAFYYFRAASAPPISFENITLRKLSQSGDVTFTQITPDGKSIVYSTIDENGTRSLWIRRVEDKNALRLVANELRQFWGGTAVSPDGSQIFYALSDENARYATLYRISALGGAPRKLIERANDVGAISADGQKILFVRRNEENLQILSANTADGGGERVIHMSQPDEIFRDPQFSADDKSIFFSKRKTVNDKVFWSLIEIPAGGGAERVILESGGERIGELAVLKNGEGILLNKSDDVSKLQQIYYLSLADGKLRRITNDLNSYNGIGVSADGTKIATTQNLTARDIWVGKDAESLRRVTTESNVHSNGVFTPDGRIVYDALDNNRAAVWIMNADGSGAQQLTSNDSFDYEPHISPDGRFIIFTSDRTGERKLWRMNLDGSNPALLANVAGATYAPVVVPNLPTVWFRWNRENRQILAKIPAAGGDPVEQQPPFGDDLWAISPDGKQLAQVFFDEPDDQFKVRVRPAEAAEPAKVFNIAAAYFLKWTPDGKNLLYRSLEASPEMLSAVWMQPLSGGAPKQFLSVKPDRVFNLSYSPDGKQMLIIRTKTVTDAVMLSRIR